MIAFVGLGSNLSNPIAQLNKARRSISELADTHDIACSSYYRSAPMGPTDQPDFINAVIAIETQLGPFRLLNALQSIEHNQGRTRNGHRWGARTLDLDIVLYGDRSVDDPELMIPHPGIREREFVLYPLGEIAPADLYVPNMGRLRDLIARCPLRNLAVIGHA